MVTLRILYSLNLLFCGLATQAQYPVSDQYAQEFSKAGTWIKTTAPEWKKMAQEGYDINLAKAIIFPELLRYSQLRDKIEIFGLQVLYIQFGKDYADFSIGPFQMKPSFAEQIEVAKTSAESSSTRNNRIDRLNTTSGQFMYLRKFINWMDSHYAYKKWNSMEDKIRFYAAAYNCGYQKPESYITSMLNRKYFRFTETSPDTYNYTSIAIWHYQNPGKLKNSQFDYLYENNAKTP